MKRKLDEQNEEINQLKLKISKLEKVNKKLEVIVYIINTVILYLKKKKKILFVYHQ